MRKEKYTLCWEKLLPEIKKAIKSNKEILLERETFDKLGNRKHYSFRLDIDNPKIENSAVARDLESVLRNDAEIKNLIATKHLIVKMGHDFVLRINIED